MPRRLTQKDWTGQAERASRARAPERRQLGQARLVFTRELSAEERFEVVEEIVQTRGDELRRAYRGVASVMAGYRTRTSGRKKRRRDTRGRAKPPLTKAGTLSPGTYLLTVWHDRLALVSPSLEFRCFLPETEPEFPSVEVRPRTSKALGPPTLKPVLEAGEGDLDFTIPLGGVGARDGYVVRVRGKLPFKKGVLYAHVPWYANRR